MIIITKCEFFSGWLSGMCGLFIGYPLDTVKVRMQTFEDKSFGAVVRQTYNNEGYRGFYKGLIFPLSATGIRNAVFFGVYGNSLRTLAGGGNKTLCCEDRPIPHTNYFGDNVWHTKVVISGFLGGLASTVISCPVECLKIKMQGNTESKVSFWKLGKDVVKRGGAQGLFRGFTPCAFRDGPGALGFSLHGPVDVPNLMVHTSGVGSEILGLGERKVNVWKRVWAEEQ